MSNVTEPCILVCLAAFFPAQKRQIATSWAIRVAAAVTWMK